MDQKKEKCAIFGLAVVSSKFQIMQELRKKQFLQKWGPSEGNCTRFARFELFARFALFASFARFAWFAWFAQSVLGS